MTVDTATGAYTYTKNAAAIEALDDGETASDVFTMTVNDGDDADVTQTFTVNVTGANDAPVVTAFVAADATATGFSLFADDIDDEALSLQGAPVASLQGAVNDGATTTFTLAPLGGVTQYDVVVTDGDASNMLLDGNGDQISVVIGTGLDDALAPVAGAGIYYGFAGADAITGGAGDDVIFGGADDDTIDGGAGDDVIDAGADDDTVVYDAADTTSVDGGADTDTLDATAGGAVTIDLSAGVLVNFETLLGSGSADTLTGNATAATTINAGGGADTVTGGTGNDTIDGGAGVDELTGGAGNDTFTLADGDSITDFATADDLIDVNEAVVVAPGATTFLSKGAFGQDHFVTNGVTALTGANALSLSTTDVADFLADFDGIGGAAFGMTYEDPLNITGTSYVAYISVTDGTDTGLFLATQTGNGDNVIDAAELTLVGVLENVTSGLGGTNFTDFT